MTAVPQLLPRAPEEHGVVRHALALAAALPAPGGDGAVHLHFTERLWGATPAAAAAAVEALEAPFTVTLHDLPQPGDPPARAAAYARVARAARGVVVSSAHERALLAAVCDVPAAVIPLPCDPAPPAPRPAPDGELTLLGFFWPGKGHEEAVAAAQAVGGLGVTVLGRASPGHEAELEALVRASPVPVTVTGFVPDGELLGRLRRAAVPLAAHRRLSASASITTWVAAGRRPLVPDSPAARELAALRPGTLTLYRELAPAVARARAAPESTWWGPGAETRPSTADVAAAYRAWWASR